MFAAIVGVGVLADGADGTNHAVPYPTITGGIRENDLLVVLAGIDGNPTMAAPDGTWTEAKDVAGNGSLVRGGAWWKRAAGGETGTVTFTTSASESGGWQLLVIRGVDPATDPAFSADANGSSTNPNPPSLDPAGWAIEETLWIPVAFNDGNVAITAAPASYSGLVNTRRANTAGAGVAHAWRQNRVASEDPGTFTMTTEQWGAFTIAIRPDPLLPASIGSDFAAISTTSETMTVTNGGAAVGQRVIIVCGDDGSNAGSSSVTDSKGNTYVADSAAMFSADSYRGRVWSSVITTALLDGDTITVNFSGRSGTWDTFVHAFRSSAIGSVDDVASNSAASGTGWSTGSTPSTTETPPLLCFALAVAGGAPSSSTATLPALEAVDSGAASAFIDWHVAAYREDTSGAAESIAGTWSASDAWAAVIVAYAAATGSTTFEKAGALVSSSVAAGADVREAAELGALLAGARSFAADVREAVEAGSLLPSTTLAAADSFQASEAGTLAPSSLIAGPSTYEAAARGGSLIAGALLAAADVFEASEAGSLASASRAAAIDALELPAAGDLLSGAALFGPGSFEAAEAGALLAGALSAGDGRLEASEAGALIAGALASGAGFEEGGAQAKSGSLLSGALLAAAKAAEFLESGALSPATGIFAADAAIFSEAGALLAGTFPAGTEASEHHRSGLLAAAGLIAVSSISGGADIPITGDYDLPSPEPRGSASSLDVGSFDPPSPEEVLV